MKKKLEAELISIAHKILKMKNRSELDQLQAETLKLYEKISVLRFVEDNFADVKPTIGYASAEGKLEDIYGIEEVPEVHANEIEAAEDKARAEKKEQAEKDATAKTDDNKEQKSEEPAENTEDKTDDIKQDEGREAKPEGDADPQQEVEEYQASEEEKQHTEEETDEEVKEEEPEVAVEPAKEEQPEVIKEPAKEEAAEEPEQKVEVIKPEEELKAMEEGAAAVFKKEDDSTPEEEEKAIDAEIVTIVPDANAETEKSDVSFDFAFERTPAPEEPQKQKEISFEDFHDYKEPEFVKKDDKKEEQPKAEEVRKEEPKAEADDWRNWEPKKDPQPEAPKAEQQKQEEPKAAPATSRPLNETFGKTISLGLNDRIAFEKHLFGGSSEDLNRVISQINTQNSFDEAKAFIEDLVKPDYNNWSGKEEYESRFMELVEKRFS